MLKKIAVVCSLLVLLSTVAVAAPAKGQFVVTAPLITANGITGFGSFFDGYSFGDDGFITVLGTRQSTLNPLMPMMYANPWSFGYCVTDNLEVGLNIMYMKAMGSDPMLNLGVYGTYYLKMDKLMPFIQIGLTQIDITDNAMGSTTVINSSIGLAYAMSKTVAPYLSIDFNTWVDYGTCVNLTLGLKFMF